MTRHPIRIRTFILGTFLVLLLSTTSAGGAAWLIERHHQQHDAERRVNTAVAYLVSHRAQIQEPATIQGFARLLGRLDLLAQVVIAGQSEKTVLYVSPALTPALHKEHAAGRVKAAPLGTGLAKGLAPWTEDHKRLIPAGTRKAPRTLVTDVYYQRPSRPRQALIALLSGIVVLLAGLAVAIWLAGRWMVAPLARLSSQVDKVAGGDLEITVPGSRIGEIGNIAQAVEGMTAALGETAARRAEADEARRFLVTSVAHDLRTPLFALRGHLQAIGSRVGDPAVHLQRAEARADALERLVGNLFAYTRDDYAQPSLQLEAVPVAELLAEVTAGLEHATRVRDTSFALDGDRSLCVVVDRDRAKRALTNILDNAVRHNPAGAAVNLCWVADESTVRVAVEDHGAGIDDELLPHVFEPGIRGNPATGNTDDGAGLGLTIAKRLLEHQDATLSVGNRPSGGAVVAIVFRRGPSPAHGPDEL